MKRWLPVLVLLTACTSEEPANAPQGTTTFTSDVRDSESGEFAPYNFDRPQMTVELPEELTEISGLTILGDGRLAAVQDEIGTVFILNRESGAVEERQSFAGAGDYEGIELVGNRLFVLLSDGTLTELVGEGTEPRVIDTHLRAKNDTEGLGYDEGGRRLLIACKEDPGSGLDKEHKAIYAYDLESGTLHDDPAFVIDTDALEQRYDVRGTFKPAAVALHPSNGSLYVLSATSRAIAVLSPGGEVTGYLELPREMFEQPEALAFASDSRLYVASEGGDGPGMLYAFAPSN